MERTTTTARKIMVVADPGRESAGALQWALHHSVVEHDELILLHVENSSSWRKSFGFLKRPPSQFNTTFASTEGGGGGGGGGELDFLDQMKKASEAIHPRIKVHIERVGTGDKDRASTILMQCKELTVDVLVIGQRRSISAILGRRMSSGATKGMDTAEYLLQHSQCTCVGVQKKGQNGGYVLNTRTHRNFWQLA